MQKVRGYRIEGTRNVQGPPAEASASFFGRTSCFGICVRGRSRSDCAKFRPSCLLLAAWYTPPANCYLLFAMCCLLLATWYLLPATCYFRLAPSSVVASVARVPHALAFAPASPLPLTLVVACAPCSLLSATSWRALPPVSLMLAARHVLLAPCCLLLLPRPKLRTHGVGPCI